MNHSNMPLALAAVLIVQPALLQAAADDKPVETLQRNGKWIVRFDQDRCMLLGQFGEGKNMVTMRVVNNAPGDWFYLSVFGNRLKASYDRVSARVDFGLSKPIPTTAYFVTSGETPGAMFDLVRIDGWEAKKAGEAAPPVTTAQESAVTGLTVRMEGKAPFRLNTGSLNKQFTLIRTCIDDLMQSWGYDPAVQNKLTDRPKPLSPPYRWLDTRDYPPDALSQGHNGLVEFRLAVDVDGKVEGCHILEATEPDDFARITCAKLSLRARFKPALDAEGKPVRSFFTSRVSWRASP